MYQLTNNISVDAQFFVAYKGQLIENFKGMSHDAMLDEAILLERTCLILESKDIPINVDTVIWHHGWFIEMPKLFPFKVLLAKAPRIYEKEDQVVFVTTDTVFWTKGDVVHLLPFNERIFTESAMLSAGYKIADIGQPHGSECSYGHFEGIIELLHRHQITPDSHRYLVNEMQLQL